MSIVDRGSGEVQTSPIIVAVLGASDFTYVEEEDPGFGGHDVPPLLSSEAV